MTVFRYSPLSTFIVATLTTGGALAAPSDEVMVVTASGFQQKIEDSAASISVVTREDLEKRAYTDVTDALKDVPGVVVTGGGSSRDISIRGMGAKYTLMLIDGRRVDTRGTRPNSDGPGIEQGWMPPLQAIERIEVVRGPMSSLYGSDAMGGVINIITRKTSKGPWQGTLHSDATMQENRDSGDQFQGSGYAGGALIDGLLGLRLTGQMLRRDEDQIVNGFNEQRTRNGGVALTLTPSEQHRFDLDISRTLQDRNGTPGQSRDLLNSRGQPNSASLNRYEHTVYALTHNGQFDGASSTSYVQREQSKNPGRAMQLDNTLFNTQTQFNLGAHILSLGGQYRYEELEDLGNQLAGAGHVNQLDRRSWALFAEDEWAITDRFALTGGLRLDDDENYGSHWSPRLYGVWHLDDEWTLKGGVSSGYRSPELRMAAANWGQATGGGSSDGVIVGNPDLKPEQSVSEEIALLWNNRAGLSTGLTLFNTDFKDKITEVRRCSSAQDPACTINGHSYDFVSDRVNVDKANMRGVEGTLEWAINDAWSLASSYTWTDSEQKSGVFSGQPLNQMPRHMFNTKVDWAAADDLDVWARANFRGKTSEYLNRVTMADGTPSYTFVDLGLRYRANRHLDVTAGVYNLFDKTVDYASYQTVLDGRRYNLGVTYNF